MIVNNTQANIFKVNGGLADIFANRPAANGSFYLFYSTDTQEIFYDNGAWVLMGSGGGGGGVNIYNSDGTLTGNRTLNAVNLDLNFQNVNNLQFNFEQLDLIAGTKFLRFNSTFNLLYTQNGSDLCGIYLNFNGQYRFGQISGLNSTYLDIDRNQDKVSIRKNAIDIGLKLDFANQSYIFGDQNILNTYVLVNNDPSVSYFASNTQVAYFSSIIQNIGYYSEQLYIENGNNIQLGDINGVNNSTKLIVSDINQNIYTQHQGNDNGLKLDFANNVFSLGNVINQQFIIIDEQNFINQIVSIDTNVLGANNGTNNTSFLQNTNLIKTSYGGNDIGLKLDFANSVYQFGQITGGNGNFLEINDISDLVSTKNNGVYDGLTIDYNAGQILLQLKNFNNIYLGIDGANQNIQTYFNAIVEGISLNFNNSIYQFGKINGGNSVRFEIDEIAQTWKFKRGAVSQGIDFDYPANIYKIGQINAGQGHNFQIHDNQAFPFYFNGNNATQNTSGSTSGKHLRVKINGTDYVIELKNP